VGRSGAGHGPASTRRQRRTTEAEIARWRKNYDRGVRSEKGPLWLIARHNLAEGKTGIGSDPSSRILLPDRAPKRVGAIECHSDKVTFEPAAGIAVS